MYIVQETLLEIGKEINMDLNFVQNVIPNEEYKRYNYKATTQTSGASFSQRELTYGKSLLIRIIQQVVFKEH